MLNAGNIVDELRALCQQHPASHHPLFDFLASEASAAQIDYFFKSDSALNLLFFDLVAMGLVGSLLPETRAEIAQNLWDEIGQGSTEITHVNLYKDLLKRRISPYRTIILPICTSGRVWPGITPLCWAA